MQYWIRWHEGLGWAVSTGADPWPGGPGTLVRGTYGGAEVGARDLMQWFGSGDVTILPASLAGLDIKKLSRLHR